MLIIRKFRINDGLIMNIKIMSKLQLVDNQPITFPRSNFTIKICWENRLFQLTAFDFSPFQVVSSILFRGIKLPIRSR